MSESLVVPVGLVVKGDPEALEHVLRAYAEAHVGGEVDGFSWELLGGERQVSKDEERREAHVAHCDPSDPRATLFWYQVTVS